MLRVILRPSCIWDARFLKVKERVELYIYFLHGPSWPVIGRTLPLPFTVFVLLVANLLTPLTQYADGCVTRDVPVLHTVLSYSVCHVTN